MTYKTNILLLLISLAVFTGCIKEETHNHGHLRLAINPWIGYTPIYYAEEMGWLEESGIKLIHTTSLQETVHYFQANLIDAFVSTQYEPRLLDKDKLVHFLPIDRSNGGDVILSNRPLENILKSKNTNVYLEVDSVNQLIFDTFIQNNSLLTTNFNLINKEQTSIKSMTPAPDEDTLIITYEPYASTLRNNGFKEIASTKSSNLLVLDSLYVNSHSINEHNNQLNRLKSIIKKAYKELQEDPKTYYETIKHYLEDQSYSDFINSLSSIEWLLDKDTQEINKILKSHNVLPVKVK